MTIIKHNNCNYERMSNGQNENCITQKFEIIFEKYSPKAFGFISIYTASHNEKDKYLIKVFLEIWKNLGDFEHLPDKKFTKILLEVCRPLLRGRSI